MKVTFYFLLVQYKIKNHSKSPESRGCSLVLSLVFFFGLGLSLTVFAFITEL